MKKLLPYYPNENVLREPTRIFSYTGLHIVETTEKKQ